MSDETPQVPQLSQNDARILGSLIEKEATTPDAYPLTVNAIVLACNQKTAREPIMELDADEVAQSLRQLEPKGWVKSQHSSRSERYAHRVERVLQLTQPQCALLALLMLRGPQTAHELMSRSERMAKFESADDVVHALERLVSRGLAMVLPRQSGQRGDRYAHLLCGEPDAVIAQEAAATGIRSGLTDRVSELEARVAELEARLDALTQVRSET